MINKQSKKLNTHSDGFNIIDDFQYQINKKRINIAAKCYGAGFWLFLFFFIREAYIWNQIPDEDKGFNKYVSPSMTSGIVGMVDGGGSVLIIRYLEEGLV